MDINYKSGEVNKLALENDRVDGHVILPLSRYRVFIESETHNSNKKLCTKNVWLGNAIPSILSIFEYNNRQLEDEGIIKIGDRKAFIQAFIVWKMKAG